MLKDADMNIMTHTDTQWHTTSTQFNFDPLFNPILRNFCYFENLVATEVLQMKLL